MVPLLLIFFAAWCHNLGLLAFTSDEAATALMADMRLGGIWRQNQDSPHGPVYNLLMRVWRTTTGSLNEFTGRYVSVLLGLLLLALMYGAGRGLGLQPWGALAVAGLVGVNPQITVHLREARPYAPMLATMALAIWVTLRFERLRGAVWLAAGASALALLSHYFSIPFVGVLGLWGFLIFKGPARRRWVFSQGMTWVFLAIWLPLMGRAFFSSKSLNTGKTWSFLLPPWETLARVIGAGAGGYREYQANWLAYVAGALLIGGWLLGCWAAPRRQRWFLFLTVALPLTAYALLCWVRPVFHPKYILPWLLFANLALAVAVTRRPKLGGVVGAGLLVCMVMPAWRTLQLPYDPGVTATTDLSPLQRVSAQGVLQLAEAHDVFASGTPDPVHCFYLQHYFDHSLDCALAPNAPTQTEAAFTDQMTALLANHRLLWYLGFYNPGWDPQRLAETVLGRSFVSLGQENVAGRDMRLYTAPATVMDDALPLGARFGAVAQLEGVWQARTQALHLVFVWRSLAEQPAVDAHVFVHLVDEDGQLMTQADGVPLAGTRPVNTWRQDEQLLDTYTVDLAPGDCAAGCAVQIGLYDPAASTRIPAYDAAGQLLTDDAVVVPVQPWSTAAVEMRH